ncbi:hypothetical protein GCM10007913_08640 [Devosia yakushimensis]|uniref:Uncharacterized protein n=1 Tax=Devosia yakushimensis TaxID=470028 RepID=A0ABQ5U9W4_9HYPH|nr:hypothetical protein [Devosia yakushimensis]GLQ08932.1 hypothetical protein GCM10007913_08640 [Devosia yakushimensis]
MSSIIDDPASFLHDLGELHDVSVRRVIYAVEQSMIDIEVADLNWNFEGAADYVPRPARLAFTGVSAFSIAAGQNKFHTTILAGPASIAHAYAITKAGTTRIDIVMSTSEQWHIEFETLTIHDNEILAR